MGKSKSKTRSREVVNKVDSFAPSTQYQPYIDDAADGLQSGYQDALENNRSLQPRINQGLDYYSDVLGGKFMGGNPYLEAVIGRTNQSIADGVNSQFSGAGRYGSGYHAGTLADRIAGNENQLRYQDYATERGYMDNASRGVAGLATTSAALPQLAGSEYAQQIAALLGRYGTGTTNATSTGNSTTTQSQGVGGLLAQIAGSAAAGFAASDRRLKENVERVGELEDGLGVYRWEYRADSGLDLPGGKHVGVMADEVAELRPWALGPELPGGFATVAYGRL